MLIAERPVGVDLGSYARGRPLAVASGLGLGLGLAERLAAIHEHRVLHRDLEPRNVAIDPRTGAVSLAHLGISALLEHERRHLYEPMILAGTLPYLSPEQTGRTGRPVDARSDLYALGVILYELLTGERPFVGDDPLELIHATLARVPRSPRELRPELPEAIERVILELLAKAPEHRYQTAAGLVADLRAIADQLERGVAVELELGRHDFTPELRLPHQLYGREAERARLVAALEEVAEHGSARLRLVSGPAGSGKSALLADVVGEAARFGAYVARGKFERGRDRPYAAIVEAFSGLVEQLLTESEARLQRWRERLSAALGGVGQVIVELVPTLALIIGEQPAIASLAPPEARNRLELAVARFVAVFGEPGRPLVIILEDLQWADPSSLALLEVLIVGGPSTATLVLGSFRPEAINPSLLKLLTRIPAPRLQVVPLAPLASEAVERLLAEALGRELAEVRELARIVSRKTDDNPLLIRGLLMHLVDAGLLCPGEAGWTWDAEALAGAGIPDDALALMRIKLATLPRAAAMLLERAACIGDRFELGVLDQVVDEVPRAELLTTVYELVEDGLLDQVGGEVRFAHHGIREAALEDVEPALRRRLQRTIGRYWLETLGPRVSEHLFEIVDMLGASLGSADEPLTPAERLELAELELEAGRRALDSAAYEPALRYLDQGLAVLGDHPGPEAGTLEVELAFARASALAMAGRRAQAEQAFEALLARELDPRTHARVAASWLAHLQLAGRNREALAVGCSVLASHGCALGSTSKEAARAGLERVRARIAALDDELLDISTCTDERAAAVMDLLTPTKHAAYLVDPELYVVLVNTQVEWMLDHGYAPGAALGLAQLAICVGSMLGEVAGAIRLGEQAVALAERLDAGPVQVRVECATQLFVAHLGRPFAEPLARMGPTYARALEFGDFLWGGYAGAVALSMNLELGTHLEVLDRLCRRFEDDIGARASTEAVVVAATLRAMARILGGAPDSDEDWAILDPERLRASGKSSYAIHTTVANRALVELLLGRSRAALRSCASVLATIERALFASWIVPRVALTTIVALARLEADDDELLAELDAARLGEHARRIIDGWAANSSANYGHYRDLAEALARADPRERARLLERARAAAAGQGCRWVEALAAEELAALALRDGLPGFANGARRQAWDAYAAWGAHSRLEQLRRTHAEDFAPPTIDAAAGREAELDGDPSATVLDFESMLRSVTAIGADLRLDPVIAAVLDAAITNAGADHGVLVLEREGVLGIVAEAEIDGERRVLARPLALAEAEDRAPTSLIHFVLRTGSPVVLADAGLDPRFRDDPYLARGGARSLLGIPITHGRRTSGVLVLENRLSRASFTAERVRVLALIAGQAASALEHARVHHALREGEARWRSLVDGAPDVIALIASDGEVEFVNRGEPGEALLDRLARSPAAARWRAAIAAVLAEGSATELELELSREGERSGWYVARFAPIEVEGPRKAIVIVTDVSARKHAELENQALDAQLRQQQRLESIGTLASGVAHEINNPVQGILNYAELIAGRSREVELVEEFAGEIAHEAERVAAIVRNLLAFSRHEGPQPATVLDLREVVESTLSLIHAILRKDHIILRVAIPAGLPQSLGRSQQIQQIVMNLVTNARDALNGVYEGYDERKVIEIRAEHDQRWVRLIVEDHGPGIPAEVLPRIFDPFFTTKGRDQGTGLGLAVAHGIARDHGGELRVESEPGQGARFALELPIVDA